MPVSDLKHNQTQFLTQASTPAGSLVGFIAASFRVWMWSTQASTPQQVSSIAMNVANQDAIIVKTSALCFVCDGGFANFLYAVNTSNQAAPVILGSIDLSAP